MKYSVIVLLVCTLLAACGVKGELKRPADIEREQQKKERPAGSEEGNI